MIDLFEREFAFLITDRGFSKRIENVTFVVKNLIYEKNNIRIILTCELMSETFDFEIWFKYEGKEYSVCERKGRKILFYQNREKYDVIHQSIFKYSVGIYDELLFQKSKDELLHRGVLFNRSKKFLIKNIILYKSLLCTAINNIEQLLLD